MMRTVSARQVAALVAIIAAALTWTSSAALATHPPSPHPPSPSPPSPSPGPTPAPNCGRIVGEISPCLPFVKGTEKEPSRGCCTGTKKLSAEATTTELMKEACECITHAMKHIKGVKKNLVAEVPEKCGIKTKLPPIDADFDCSKIKSTIYRSY